MAEATSSTARNSRHLEQRLETLVQSLLAIAHLEDRDTESQYMTRANAACGMGFLAVAFAANAVASTAWAQQGVSKATHSSESITCFEVVYGNQNAVPRRPILLNRCTGATWLLEQGFARDSGGKLTHTLGWYWSPLPIRDVDGMVIDSFPTGTVAGGSKAAIPTAHEIFHF